MILNEAGIIHLFTDTDGGIARSLEDTGEAVAIAAQENVGSQFTARFSLNPPPGPPMRRSGDLQNSIRSTPAIVVTGGMEVNVVADSSHRGFAYPIWLRAQGYKFVNLESFAG